MADRLPALLSGNVAPKARRARAHRAHSEPSRSPTAPLSAQSPAHAHNSLSRGRARPGSLAEPRAPLQSRGRFHRSMSCSRIRPVAQVPKGAGRSALKLSDQSHSSARARTIDLGRGVHRSQEGDRAAQRARAEGGAQASRRARAGAGSKAPPGVPPLKRSPRVGVGSHAGARSAHSSGRKGRRSPGATAEKGSPGIGEQMHVSGWRAVDRRGVPHGALPSGHVGWVTPGPEQAGRHRRRDLRRPESPGADSSTVTRRYVSGFIT